MLTLVFIYVGIWMLFKLIAVIIASAIETYDDHYKGP